jgi:RNA polymerase sigma factor (sigma-70 family)
VRRRLGLTLRRRVNSEDVLQDVLLEATKAFQCGKAPPDVCAGGFFPWLAKMIDNRIKNLARFHVATGRRAVIREVPFEGNEKPAPSDGAGRTPSSFLLAIERKDEVGDVLQQLTPKERELIQLLYYERMTVGEAAKALSKTPGATAVLHCETLKKLVTLLKRRGYAP